MHIAKSGLPDRKNAPPRPHAQGVSAHVVSGPRLRDDLQTNHSWSTSLHSLFLFIHHHTGYVYASLGIFSHTSTPLGKSEWRKAIQKGGGRNTQTYTTTFYLPALLHAQLSCKYSLEASNCFFNTSNYYKSTKVFTNRVCYAVEQKHPNA